MVWGLKIKFSTSLIFNSSKWVTLFFSMNECISSSKKISDEQQLNQVEHDLKRYKYNIFWCLSYTNVVILMFGFIDNLLRFLGMRDDNVWFIPRNFKWIIYFSYSILKFECELPSPLKKYLPLNK